MYKTEKYDVVIIGSGLGGLISGAVLSKNNKKVCVLEKNPQIGGNLQVFTRKGCRFSAGMHYGGSLDNGQILHKIFSYLGIYKDLKLTRLDKDAFEKIIIGDKEYAYAIGMENFKKKLIEYFPGEKQVIEDYTKKIDEIWNNSDFLNLRNIDFGTSPILEEYKENAYDYISSLTDNEDLKSLLFATNGLYVMNKDKTPFYIHAVINNFYIKSAWRIAENGGNIAKLLMLLIQKNGGKVLINKDVEKLNFIDNKIVSATAKGGEQFYADNFISNIHPISTFKLIEQGKLRKAYINRVRNLENSISAFVLFIVLEKRKIKHINSNIYYSKTNDVWSIYDYTESDWPKGYVMYTTEDSENKGYAESVVVISMMKYNDVKQWAETQVMKRGDDYLKFKEKKAKQLLDVVSIKFPQVKESINSIYSATPLTFRDYTNTFEGTMYGIVKDCNNPLNTFISSKTRVPNLLLTGQNVGLHGLLGVIMTAFKTCSAIIDINKVFNQIKMVNYEKEI